MSNGIGSGSSTTDAAVVVAAAAAAVGIVALSALQSDAVSRRLLSPARLAAKRRSSHQYAWNQALLRQSALYYQQHSNMQQQQPHESGGLPVAAPAAEVLLTTDAEIQAMVERIVATATTTTTKHEDDNSSPPAGGGRWRVSRIGRDEHAPTASAAVPAATEYFVWVHHAVGSSNTATPTTTATTTTTTADGNSSSNNNNNHDTDGTAPVAASDPGGHSWYQLPLTAFGTALAAAFEQRVLTSVTLCIVYDAAAGRGADCLVNLAKVATQNASPLSSSPPNHRAAAATTTAVQCHPNPAWMVQWALLSLQQQQINSGGNEMMARVLYALCRLEALQAFAARDRPVVHTVLYTIPTAVVPILLPALHDIFPDDRHVFCYTGCVAVVAAAAAPPFTARTARNRRNSNRRNFWEFNDPVAFTTPIRPLRSAHLVLAPHLAALAALPVNVAAVTECWMAAVDCYLERKLSTTANPYLPYVCKLDYLLVPPDPQQRSEESSSPSTTSSRYLSCRSLLQYVTGSKSRELPPELLDAACSYLRDDDDGGDDARHRGHNSAPPRRQQQKHAYQRRIEDAVFPHKQILLANKTLVDTVLPARHWTLKQAAKAGGCACCAPDDDDDDTAQALGTLTTALPGVPAAGGGRDGGGGGGGTSSPAARRRGYVDGKSGFAFDPGHFAA